MITVIALIGVANNIFAGTLEGSVKGSEGRLLLVYKGMSLGVDFQHKSMLSGELASIYGIDKKLSENEISELEKFGIDGVIGSDILSKYDLTIDRLRFRFNISEPAEIEGEKRFQIIESTDQKYWVRIGERDINLDFLRVRGQLSGVQNDVGRVWSNSSQIIPQLSRCAYARIVDKLEDERVGVSLFASENIRISLSKKMIRHWNTNSLFNTIFALTVSIGNRFMQLNDEIYFESVPSSLAGSGISEKTPLIRVNDMHIKKFVSSVEKNENEIYTKLLNDEYEISSIAFNVNGKLVEVDLK